MSPGAKGIIKAALVLGFALGAIAIVVASQPSKLHVSRSIEIAAERERVFPLVNTLASWQRWSPWEDRDPAMERRYEGPPAGVGAEYAWAGSEDVGKGAMWISDSQPSHYLALELRFEEPFAARNDVSFNFEEIEGGTRVTWTMTGDQDFAAKLASLFIDTEAMVGADFETGLAALERVAESEAGRE